MSLLPRSDASSAKKYNLPLPTLSHRRSRSAGTAVKEKDYERLAQVFGWRQEALNGDCTTPDHLNPVVAPDVLSSSYNNSLRREFWPVVKPLTSDSPSSSEDLNLTPDALRSYPTHPSSFLYKPREAHQANPISGQMPNPCDSIQPSPLWSPSAITSTLEDIEEMATAVATPTENEDPKLLGIRNSPISSVSKSAPSSPPCRTRLWEEERKFEHNYPRDPRLFDFLHSNDDPYHILWFGASSNPNSPTVENPSGTKETDGNCTEKREPVLMAATLEKLVEILTREIDYTFMTDFFLVYRTFCTPLQLCNLLILRFRWALSQNLEERRVVRIRTFVVLRHWLFHYYTHDFLPSRPLRRMLFLYLDSLPEHAIVRSSPLDARIVRSLRQMVRRLTKAYPAVVRTPTVKTPDERQSSINDSDAARGCVGHESTETCKNCARRSYLDLKSDSSDEQDSSSEKSPGRKNFKSNHSKPYPDTASSCVFPESKINQLSLFPTTSASNSDIYDHRAPPVPGATDGRSTWSRTWTITMGKLARVKRMVIGRGSRSVVSDSPLSVAMDPKYSSKALTDPHGIIDFNGSTPSYLRDNESREPSPRSSVCTGSSCSMSKLGDETPSRHRYLFDIDDTSESYGSNVNADSAKISARLSSPGLTQRSNSLNSSLSKSPNPKLSHSLRVPYRSFVAAYRSEAVAQQMCLVERDVLIAVSWKELLERSWCKPGLVTNEGTSGVTMVIERFNQTCQWVVSEIASVATVDDRARLIEKFVRIALKCYQHANFASLTQILLGLQSPNIARLCETWTRVGAYETRVLKDLQDFSSPARNWKRIREAMLRVVDEWGEGGDLPGPAEEAVIADEGESGSGDANKEKPKIGGCVPFLGLYLSDLTFIAELPSYIDPPRSPCEGDVTSDATDEQPVKSHDCRSSLLSSSSTLYSLSRNPSFNDGGIDARGLGKQHSSETVHDASRRDEPHHPSSDRLTVTYCRPKSDEKKSTAPRTEPGSYPGRPRLTSPPQRPAGGRLVNFHKHRIIAVVLKRALAFQTLAKRYPFRTDANLRAQCSRLRCLDNETVRVLASSFGEYQTTP